jgi:hypothetical protein
MPKCKACEHPQRKEIDLALLSNVPQRLIATQYGLSQACIARHAREHIKPKVAVALERKEEKYIAKTAEELDGTLSYLLDSAVGILESCKGKDQRTSIAAIAEARACIQAAKKIADGVTVNVQVNNVLTDEDLIQRAKVYLGGT